MVCFTCGEGVIEYDIAAGNGYCTNCGTVIEENTIVNEISFGETSTGAAMVQGSYVAQGATRARLGGPWGNRRGGESREQTIANASRKIQSVAVAMRISEAVATAAVRTYTLAVEHKFTKGRKSTLVVGVCLYVACRQQTTQNRFMLIDFADILQVNVFELGHTYLQLIQTLNLRIPFSDPSWFINRYAALLEFGDETQQVAADATRLVSRFNRDWMVQGRRPAGICGACLLLAARMNNFRRSVEEIVQVVKIADTTLKKRLDEFRKTPSGKLTLADFRRVWLEEEQDPPAFTKGNEKEERERQKLKGKKRKRERDKEEEEEEEEEEETQDVEAEMEESIKQVSKDFDPLLFGAGMGAGQGLPLFLPDVELDEDTNIDPALREKPPPSPLEKVVDDAVAEEVSSVLQTDRGLQVSQALNEAESRRNTVVVSDEFVDLDDEELDQFILTEEEVKIKERVWVEMNKDYLEAIAEPPGQRDQEQKGSFVRRFTHRRKTSTKPRDTSTPHGTTAAESVRNLLKKNPKYSKKINYAVLDQFFKPEKSSTPDDEEEEEVELYRIDENEKDDGEGEVVEEGGEYQTPLRANPDYEEDEDDKPEEYGGWEDTFEQEA
ncbi:cyclin-like protein [Thelephora ganbajun]|uniref:Cyclin-like protein n=1 Tax=Thelephora ganbajun TaxID=370292 RepID=A0ACB6ZT75_THEGA|nr:cyclin-like protein [Thelephora ganbajun]